MKLSIAWIFDHIDARWQDHDITHIMAKFNQVTAEIEHFYEVNYDLSSFYLAQFSTTTRSTAFIKELNQEISIADRTDAGTVQNPVFMVKKVASGFIWASLADFGVEKDGLLPAFDADDADLAGGWRQKFEARDIIIEVDNKSITHRPDMWGHRGFAREIAAFLKLPLRAPESFLAQLPKLNFDKKSEPTKSTPFVIENQIPHGCRNFAGLYFPSVENKPSNLFITSRLLKVDARPINGIVDLTNYAMLDWTKPVHAYDADKLVDKKVIIRMAQEGEKLLLLDGNEITLTHDDMVIADSKKPVCLAGIKGGKNDSIDASTKSVFFESATFDPRTIRLTAIGHKTRTDSSARFEKTLDPNLAYESILRFIQLTKQTGIVATHAQEVIVVGVQAVEETIQVPHAFLEKQAGFVLSQETIVELLTRLEFKVSIESHNPLVYNVLVPTFRSSKDVKVKEDILEEVMRSYGFDKIPLVLPPMNKVAFDMTSLRRGRKIRQFLAHSVHMTEQQNYSMFDEQVMMLLGVQEEETISIVNPVSENYRRLITTLVPGLLKNVMENSVHNDTLYFFEMGRTWHRNHLVPAEKKQVAGIFFEKRKQVDFYMAKQHLISLVTMLGFDVAEMTWHKVSEPTRSWYRPYQSVSLSYKGVNVGFAGKIDPAFMHRLDFLPESDAFIFELDADFLLQEQVVVKKYRPISRFQETFFDVSVLVPLVLASADVQGRLQKLSSLISKVELIDLFEKESWHDVRSLTFRVWLGHQERSLEKDEIDAIWKQAIAEVEKSGGQIRS